MEAPAKKKRRRLKTPPPADDKKTAGDFYDEVVLNTYDEATKEAVKVTVNCVSNDVLPSEKSDIIDLQQDDSAINLDGDDPVVDCTLPEVPLELRSASPPPPVYNGPSKPHRMTKAARDALCKIQKVSADVQFGMYQDSYEEFQMRAAESVRDSITDSSTTSSSSTIKLLVKLDGEYSRYELSRKDPLSKLKTIICAQRQDVNPDRILLFFNDRVIDKETADSLNLTVADTVEACIADKPLSDKEQQGLSTADEEQFAVKIQGKHGCRDVAVIPTDPALPLENVLSKFAQDKGLELSALTFTFDGERITLGDTPVDLGMDGGDCIDVSGY